MGKAKVNLKLRMPFDGCVFRKNPARAMIRKLQRVFSSDNLKAEVADGDEAPRKGRRIRRSHSARLLRFGKDGAELRDGATRGILEEIVYISGSEVSSSDSYDSVEERAREWLERGEECEAQGCTCVCHRVDRNKPQDRRLNSATPSPALALLELQDEARRLRCDVSEVWMMVELDGRGAVAGLGRGLRHMRADVYSTREAAIAAAMLKEARILQRGTIRQPLYEDLGTGFNNNFQYVGTVDEEDPYANSLDEVLKYGTPDLSRYMLVRMPFNPVTPFHSTVHAEERLGDYQRISRVTEQLGLPPDTPLSELTDEDWALVAGLRDLAEIALDDALFPCFQLPPVKERTERLLSVQKRQE